MNVHAIRDRFSHLPQVLNSVEELPQVLLELFKIKVDIENKINLVIYIPPQRFLKRFIGSRFVPEQALLFTGDSVIQLQGKNDEQPEGTVRTIEAKNITYIRMQLLLLYGKIDIHRSHNGNINTGNNGSESISSEYNTTSFYMIKPGLRDLIKNTWKDIEVNGSGSIISTDLDNESQEFKRLPFKVKSGMRYYALHPEEEIQNMLFQPEVRRFKIKLIPKTLIAFTNKQLIILEDLLSSPYGWIITYFQKNDNMSYEINRKNSIVSILGIEFGKNDPDKIIQLRLEEKNAHRFIEYLDKI